jgi:hypothetical protein
MLRATCPSIVSTLAPLWERRFIVLDDVYNAPLEHVKNLSANPDRDHLAWQPNEELEWKFLLHVNLTCHAHPSFQALVDAALKMRECYTRWEAYRSSKAAKQLLTLHQTVSDLAKPDWTSIIPNVDKLKAAVAGLEEYDPDHLHEQFSSAQEVFTTL